MTSIADIALPALLVAPDGWVSVLRAADTLARWNLRGMRKYNRIGFVLIDRNGETWRLREVRWKEGISGFERAIARVTGRTLPAILTLEPDDRGFAAAKRLLEQAVRQDDDMLTQFASERRILEAINKAEDQPSLLEALTRLRVVD